MYRYPRYDRDMRGRAPSPRRPVRRYRRAYDGAGEPRTGRRGMPMPRVPRRARGLMEQMRRNPMRSGLIGLGVAGVAGPLAIGRQQETRTDAAHEQGIRYAAPVQRLDDMAVGNAWRAAEASVAAERERTIGAKVSEFAEFGVSRELAEEIYDVALAEELDPDVAFGLVRAESSFRNSATSPVGAVGLTQLMPATAREVQPGVSRGELRDPETNLRIGFKYLRRLIDKYDGNENLALLAYNRGPGTVDRALKRGQNPDNGYADFVRGKADHGHTLFTR